MPPAAGVVSQTDRVPMMIPTAVEQAPAMLSDTFAKDAIISWFRGEFAAANAIIDALCSHLTQLETINGGFRNRGRSEYESAFSAIHQRRLNWIPILQMQKYFSIADVSMELRRVVEAKKVRYSEVCVVDDEAKKIGDVVEVFSNEKEKTGVVPEEHSPESNGNTGTGDEALDEDSSRDDSRKSEITDTGSQDVHPLLDNIEICSNDEDWEARCAQIKMTKGFVAKEPVKGHTVNVVRGLKLYEDIFSEMELSKLSHYVNELRAAGENGELSGGPP